ncbi:MAG: acyl-[acyl-carrier-protein] thioesterase [Acidimicrobiales bacterium]
MEREIMAPPVPGGRTFAEARRVRLGDVAPSARVRLDALARYLQDVAGDDGEDAAMPEPVTWVVRRVALDLHRPPRFGEELELVTFCSGTGRRWAERRTTVTTRSLGEVLVEAAALWVCVDRANGRPVPLPASFEASYGSAAAGRRAGSRLHHCDPPDAPSLRRRRWPLRYSDLDVLGHVNNAASWEAVEDELAALGETRPPRWAEIEYRNSVEPGMDLELVSAPGDAGGSEVPDEWSFWLCAAGEVRTSAVIRL